MLRTLRNIRTLQSGKQAVRTRNDSDVRQRRRGDIGRGKAMVASRRTRKAGQGLWQVRLDSQVSGTAVIYSAGSNMVYVFALPE